MEEAENFDQFETAAISLRGTHQVVDLMELVRPLDVNSAVQDDTKLTRMVVASVYKVENLNTSAFLTDTGK